MTLLPDINLLDNSLTGIDAMMGAAEAHGALCGMLCARGVVDRAQWIQHVLGEQHAEGQLEMATQQLAQMYRATIEQINDAVADFHLLLPDDDESLAQRVEALASWCQGFVYGLAAGGVSQGSELPVDTQELLSDFIEISRAGFDHSPEHHDEEDEIAFMEISEYVRTGILLINEELQPLKTSYTLQ